MKSVGLITEYNPFHNGHLYHLTEAKKKTKTSISIVVMSGNFLQRGEPALLSKHQRAKTAILAGADLVIELPYAFSVQQAEDFARGAIYLLNELKCDYICFGSENGRIEPFIQTYSFIQANKDKYNKQVQQAMQKGISYPSALSQAFQSLNPTQEMVDLSKPNNILGFNYIQAAKQLNDNIKLFTIQRKAADYHQTHFTDQTIASATAIRKTLLEGKDLEIIKNFVPTSTYSILQEQYTVQSWENYWPLLQYKLLSTSTEQLSKIYEMVEGLEFRFKQYCAHANSFFEFMNKIKTKRYTWNRLQRICAHVLLNVTKEEMMIELNHPKYIRLLAMNDAGRHYLNHIKKDLSIPLLTKGSQLKEFHAHLDLRATDIYSLAHDQTFRTQIHDEEFKQPIFYINHASE